MSSIGAEQSPLDDLGGEELVNEVHVVWLLKTALAGRELRMGIAEDSP